MRTWLFSAVFLCTALGLGGWTFWYEPQSLVVHRHELVLPEWPEDLDGLTVALLSDLHVGSPYYGLRMLERVVQETNANEPDLILLAGDYVIHGVKGGAYVPPEAIAPVLSRLHARLGTFAVLGNHDWWLDGPRVSQALSDSGIQMVDNGAVLTGGVWILGIGDLWEGGPDVQGALRQVRDQRPILALTHNPDVFPDVPGRVSLTLAGHTHGGQVSFPFVGAPVVPSRYGARFAHGHVVENGRHLFVTSGLGTSILPVRFRVPPEIVLLRLVQAKHARTDITGNERLNLEVARR